MSLFSLFFCCARPRSESVSGEPDENSRLIPTTEDVSPAARHVVVDQQRMKERLGVIVRAKEGKMVNVNAALPFNLNNSSKGLGRFRTRSPQPSVDTERSMSSASVSASHDFDEETRWPTLNVRIVRGGSTLARGRPIVRDVGSDRDGDDTEAADAQPEGVEGRSSDGAFKIQNVGSLSRSWGD